MPDFDSIQPGQTLPEREHQPTNASLFYYNAAIWNGHRIHYDETYTTQVEGYPAIVVDGPLQVDWVSQVVTEWLGDAGRLVRLNTSHRQAAYLGETLRAGGEVRSKDPRTGEVTLSLYIKNPRGEITTPGEAVVRFER